MRKLKLHLKEPNFTLNLTHSTTGDRCSTGDAFLLAIIALLFRFFLFLLVLLVLMLMLWSSIMLLVHKIHSLLLLEACEKRKNKRKELN